jgi:hypothetical protein
MFKDPLLDLFSSFNFTWYSILLFYAIFSNVVDFIFLNAFDKKYGGPGRYPNYLKEKLNWLYWPLFIMGGTSAVYLVTANYSSQIDGNIVNHGYDYQQFSFPLFSSNFIYIICLVIGIVATTFTLIRHTKVKDPPLFFTQPIGFIIVRSLLFDLPLSYMICTSIVRVLDQVFVLHGFYTSGWLPLSYLASDSFYGLSWAHSLLIKQIFIGLIASFLPLIMLNRRQMAAKHAKEYLITPIIFMLGISIPLLIISNDLNSMLSGINEHFSKLIIENINAFSNIYYPIDTLWLIHNYQELEILSKLPNKINLPILLEGSLGASALFWFGYITDKVFDNLWEKLPIKIKSYFASQENKEKLS